MEEYISAEDFKDFYSSIFDSRLPVDSFDEFSLSPSMLPNVPLEVSVYEVQQLFHKMRKKSPGPDGLPAWVYKNFSFCISPAFAYIFNWSLKDGYVPLCFKEALITPVQKITNPCTPSHFRPISSNSLWLRRSLKSLSLVIGFTPSFGTWMPLNLLFFLA